MSDNFNGGSEQGFFGTIIYERFIGLQTVLFRIITGQAYGEYMPGDHIFSKVFHNKPKLAIISLLLHQKFQI